MALFKNQNQFPPQTLGCKLYEIGGISVSGETWKDYSRREDHKKLFLGRGGRLPGKMWGWGQKQSCMHTVPSPTPHTYSHTDSNTHSLHIPVFALQVRSALSSHAPQNTKLQTSRVQAWEPHEPTHSAGFTRSVMTVWKNSAHKHGWSVYCLPGEPTGIRGGHGSGRAKMFVSQSLRTLQEKAPERN